MILAVIDADGEHWPVTLDRTPRAAEGVGLGAFDVELEECRMRITDQRVDRLGGDGDRARRGHGARDARCVAECVEVQRSRFGREGNLRAGELYPQIRRECRNGGRQFCEVRWIGLECVQVTERVPVQFDERADGVTIIRAAVENPLIAAPRKEIVREILRMRDRVRETVKVGEQAKPNLRPPTIRLRVRARLCDRTNGAANCSEPAFADDAAKKCSSRVSNQSPERDFYTPTRN